MFCNGPEMDGGDTAYLGPTTILEITIPRCQSSLAMTLDDVGGLAGPISYKNNIVDVALFFFLIPSHISAIFFFFPPIFGNDIATIATNFFPLFRP